MVLLSTFRSSYASLMCSSGNVYHLACQSSIRSPASPRCIEDYSTRPKLASTAKSRQQLIRVAICQLLPCRKCVCCRTGHLVASHKAPRLADHRDRVEHSEG